MSHGDRATGDPTKHVVVLALENRSFDHMIGACQAVKPAIDGIDPAGPARTNSYSGQSYPQAPGASRIVADDPRHETPHVLVQMKTDAAGMPNAGFVEDYAAAYPMLTPDGRAEIMNYRATNCATARTRPVFQMRNCSGERSLISSPIRDWYSSKSFDSAKAGRFSVPSSAVRATGSLASPLATRASSRSSRFSGAAATNRSFSR